MEVKSGPNSFDEPNLIYKLQRRTKVFHTTNSLPNRGYNLVANSSKYGLVFIASPDGTLSVYYLRQLIDKDCENVPHFTVKLQEKPSHVAISCDQEMLAVTGGGILTVYNIAAFQSQNVGPVTSIKLDVNPSTFVSALQWNACIVDTIALAFFDGTLLVAQVTNQQVKKVQAKARCICWSPKGKQLVVGNSDGTLCQYKPDLSPTKTVPAPNLFEGAPVEAVAIHWISTYQFAVVYRNAADKSRPALTIVNTPKGGQATCINYEDICYSTGSSRPWYYYLQAIPQWNIIMAASSNSMEIATLASANGSDWLQWCQSDEGRPELPLVDKRTEDYPVGVAVDTCALNQLPWGENQTLPYMPLLLVLSQSGHLILFNVLNTNNNAPQLCAPPTHFTLPIGAMSSEIPGAVQSEPAPPAQTPSQQKPLFGGPAQMAAPSLSSAAAVATPSFAAQGQNLPSFGSLAQNVTKPPQQTSLPFGQAPAPVQVKPVEPKPSVTQTPSLTAQPQPAVTTNTQQAQKLSLPTNQNTTPAIQPPTEQIDEALKAEQERNHAMKANAELKKMLIKEVNNFQNELYNFKLKIWESQNNLKISNVEAEKMATSTEFQSLYTEEFSKKCSLDELRSIIIQLKLELVRTCAVVAEARTYSDVKDYEWSQTDPLSTKRLASVKKLAYYVENQVDQAEKLLDYKWNEISSNNPKYNRPGQKMIRPILDDVYQPLVKQQEILGRQQAVLKSLKAVLNECRVSPVFKTASLLRSTPFKNKDPLSKLTKNVLNMSLETSKPVIDNKVSTQKLEALKDMLSNHATVKIKPVNIELQQHLEAMRLSYEKSFKEREKSRQLPASVTIPSKEPAASSFVQKVHQPKLDVKQPIQQVPTPSFSQSLNTVKQTGLEHVARTLFTEEPKPSNPVVESAGRTALKELLKNNAQRDELAGLKICSPTGFNASKPASTFTSNASTISPLAGMVKLTSNYQPSQSIFGAQDQTKTQQNPVAVPLKPKEKDETKNKEINTLKEKPLFGGFDLKAKSPSPDIVKDSQAFSFGKLDGIVKLEPKTETTKAEITIEKVPVPVKETQKSAESKPSADSDKKENAVKPFSLTQNQGSKPATSLFGVPLQPVATAASNGQNQASKPVSSVFGAPSKPIVITPSSNTTTKPVEAKPELAKPQEKPTTPVATSTTASASAIFSAANNSTAQKQPVSISEAQPSSVSSQESVTTSTPSTVAAEKDVPTTTKTTSVFGSTLTTPTTQTSSIFGAAVSSATTTNSIFSQKPPASENDAQKPSVFSSATPTSPSSVFGSASSSIFGSASQSVFGATTTQSSLFGAPPTTQSSIFSSPTVTAQTSIFGSPTQGSTATTTQSSVFGTPATQSSIFGSPATTQSSVFGTPTTTQASVFGTAASTQASIFGTAATSQPSVFASAATTQASIFGTAATTQASVFGSPATTQSSIFGTPMTTQSSLFGAPPSTQASVFGTANQSIFGSGTTTTQSSIFGAAPTATTQSSIFGTPATTAQSSSLFGTPDNLFASASISGNASPQASAGSIFGGGSTTGSVFGSSTGNVFGGNTAFGQNKANAAGTNNFWGGDKNEFGKQQNQGQSLFGGGFSSPSAGAFSGGQPFGGGDAFGAAQQQNAAGAFGGSPVFGSKPVFGQTAGFGSPSGFGQPAGFGGFNKSPGGGGGGGFGAGATFGGGFAGSSPGKVFGNSSPGFGSPPQANATFENLAGQDTISFGNLAQQSGQPTAQAPAFNTSPSFTGWRG